MIDTTIHFGISIDPSPDWPRALRQARLAEEYGFDHALVQDHAYNPDFVETWTLLAALGGATERIAIGPNVATAPLRLPAMIAKESATLDLITNGRLLLGLGAGAFDDGIIGMGGPDLREDGKKFRAFRDTLRIVRGLWGPDNTPFTYQGDVLEVKGVRFGPVPQRRIPIITGSMGPQSLRLTTELADGISLSSTYVPAERLPWFRQQLDDGAIANGRDPGELRMYYNLMGVIEEHPSGMRPRNPGVYWGDPSWWIDRLASLVEIGVGGFTFWPVAGDYEAQFRLFAERVVPAIRDSVTT